MSVLSKSVFFQFLQKHTHTHQHIKYVLLASFFSIVDENVSLFFFTLLFQDQDSLSTPTIMEKKKHEKFNNIFRNSPFG